MPRTKLSAKTDAQKELSTLFKAKGYALYGCVSKTAPKAGISQPTLSRRLKDVDSLSLREIRGLRTALKIPKEELMRILDGLL